MGIREKERGGKGEEKNKLEGVERSSVAREV